MGNKNKDAVRWRFAVYHNCFPVIAQDGVTWVVWGRNFNHKRRTFMGKSPDEAMDAAMDCAVEIERLRTERGDS